MLTVNKRQHLDGIPHAVFGVRKGKLMYGKVFESMFDGTLASRGPWQALVTFQQLIVLADQNGMVDMTADAISRRTSIPLEIIELGIVELLKPDPRSRTPDEDGRRIVLIDDHRDWGWQIVNHAKYQAMRNAAERREYLKLAQAKRRARLKSEASTRVNNVNKLSAKVNTSTPEDAPETEEALNTTTPDGVACARPSAEAPILALVEAPKTNGLPDCPHVAVLALWAEVLPALPQHDPAHWRGTRSDHLRARWRETAVSKHWETQAHGLAYLRKLFAYVGQSGFLIGREHDPKRRPFTIELAWLVKPGNWAQVIEGKYHAQERTA